MTYKYEGKFISLLDRLDEEERDFIFRGIDDELKEVYAKAKAFDEILDIDLVQHDEEYADNVMKVVNKYMEDK